jgi:hypothetical protein
MVEKKVHRKEWWSVAKKVSHLVHVKDEKKEYGTDSMRVD